MCCKGLVTPAYNIKKSAQTSHVLDTDYLLIVYLKTLSVAQTISIELLVYRTNELQSGVSQPVGLGSLLDGMLDLVNNKSVTRNFPAV
jgi:hypothetical protein